MSRPRIRNVSKSTTATTDAKTTTTSACPAESATSARATMDVASKQIARCLQRSQSLSARQRAFVMEYLTDYNATQAAIRAGYAKAGAKVTAHKLLTNANVAAEIARQSEERFHRLNIKADDLIARAVAILVADPRTLTGHHIGPCRYCWGIDHEYQWKTWREFRDALALATVEGKPAPSNVGGYGYRIDGHPGRGAERHPRAAG